MKLLDMKGYDPMIIEETAPYKVEIGKYQKYGELNQLKENRPIFEAVEISSETAYFYHLIFACRKTTKGSQWMDAIRRIKPKIEASNAGTVRILSALSKEIKVN